MAGSCSPDGRWIVYRQEDNGAYSLNEMHPDGTGRHVLLALPIRPRFIDWGTHP